VNGGEEETTTTTTTNTTFTPQMDVWKRGICWAATATTLIGYLYSVAARRFNFPSLAPISIDRLKGAAALAFVLTIVYESDGVKTFARTAVMEAYHDEHYHYPIIMLGALAIWFCTMKPIQGRKGFLNQHQTEGETTYPFLSFSFFLPLLCQLC